MLEVALGYLIYAVWIVQKLGLFKRNSLATIYQSPNVDFYEMPNY